MFYMWTRKRTPSPRLPDSDTDMDAEFVDVDEKNCALREHANRTHRFPTMSRGFTTFANGEGDGHTPLSLNRLGEKRVRNVSETHQFSGAPRIGGEKNVSRLPEKC